jgi:outer membrane protein assembly factor BamD
LRQLPQKQARRRERLSPTAGFKALALATALILGACGGDEEIGALPDTPVEPLYNRGLDALIEGDGDKAVQMFDEVERQHPYSQWATRAQLMAAYAYYLANRYDEAIAGLDRFIELHPGNSEIAYAYYLKAISYYEQISDVGRDQKMTELAQESLQTVLRRFPETPYARDANLKIDLARDHMAGKHMTIGRYYLGQLEYLAAINRFRIVVDKYQTTTHAPEALHRLVESYLALGLNAEAKSTAAVLGYNYPGSEWYLDSYELMTGEDLPGNEESQGWFSSLWD